MIQTLPWSSIRLLLQVENPALADCRKQNSVQKRQQTLIGRGICVIFGHGEYYLIYLRCAVLGESQKAIACYDRCLELDPNRALCWYDRGVTLVDLDHYEEAAKSYEQSIDLNPDNYWAWYQLAQRPQ